MNNLTETLLPTSLTPITFLRYISQYTFIILFITVFPFYFYVHRVNRETDKKLPIYPITNHFFKLICFMYITFIFMLLFMISVVTFRRYFTTIG
uniref:Serpentine receptor class gamma n=1 Tax=Caenorhabditis tropicalis TaxID=1561998 RepID=A0A1I7TUS1_9PELO